VSACACRVRGRKHAAQNGVDHVLPVLRLHPPDNSARRSQLQQHRRTDRCVIILCQRRNTATKFDRVSDVCAPTPVSNGVSLSVLNHPWRRQLTCAGDPKGAYGRSIFVGQHCQPTKIAREKSVDFPFKTIDFCRSTFISTPSRR